jgi:glutamate N-acetyltransferase/amino-acid N-acetyltransferase
VLVSGGDEQAVALAARAVADSPAGQDRPARRRPQLGPDRAGGRRRPARTRRPLPLDIWIGDVQVCARGSAIAHDAGALAEAATADEVDYTVALPGEGAQAELFFSDLSHEYVRINGEYTT